jgi:hypothetical protein
MTGASEEETMDGRRIFLGNFFLVLVMLGGAALSAQPRSVSAPAPPAAPILNEKDVVMTQAEMIRLLRLSPTLTTVVEHDPSLLSNQDYVAKNNPQLAAFLAQHPEVARNPDYFLFSHLAHEAGQPDEALERAVWPDVYRRPNAWGGPMNEFMHDLSPLLAFLGFLVVLIWMVRMFVENRRWGKVFKLQSEVHGRLIDKFSTSQELAAYMETDAGRRFLEAAPIAVNLESSKRVPHAVARVLTPLQIGVVMVLLGAGFLALRHASPDMDVPMLVFGMVVLMPGIGFILSAVLTWLLAARLGLMPPAEREHSDSTYGQKQ